MAHELYPFTEQATEVGVPRKNDGIARLKMPALLISVMQPGAERAKDYRKRAAELREQPGSGFFCRDNMKLGPQVRRKLVRSAAGRAGGRIYNDVLIRAETGHDYKPAIAAEVVDVAGSAEQRPGSAIRPAVLRVHWRVGDV